MEAYKARRVRKFKSKKGSIPKRKYVTTKMRIERLDMSLTANLESLFALIDELELAFSKYVYRLKIAIYGLLLLDILFVIALFR